MAEWPDWNPPEQMIERQPYLPRFMAGGEGTIARRTRTLPRQYALPHPWHQSAVDHRNIRVVGVHPAQQRRHHGPLHASEVPARVVVLRGGAPTSTAAAPTLVRRRTGGRHRRLVRIGCARKRPKPEEIAMKLLQVDALVSQGQSVAAATRKVGMTESTYFRWRQELGFKNDEPRSPKEPRRSRQRVPRSRRPAAA